jgi:LysR family transcriptional regulator, benzoate and cis,cis-muconate-responsive activator of ben and cat genes
LGTGKKRQFGIGFVASTLYDVLPELIRRFRLMAPGVEIVITELTTLEQAAALKVGRIDIGFGRLRFEDDGLARHVIHEERLAVTVPRGHFQVRRRKPLKLKHTLDVPLILYTNTPRPSYADQVLSFYRKLALEPKVGFEVRELQTALGLLAADVGIALVPLSVRRLGHDDVEYLTLDETDITSPIIMSYRANDTSPLLAKILKLAQEFEPRPRIDT